MTVKSAVKGDPKKSWSAIEVEERFEKENVGLEVSLVRIQ